MSQGTTCGRGLICSGLRGSKSQRNAVAHRRRRCQWGRVARHEIPGVAARRATADALVALEQHDLPPPPRELERDRDADHAAPDNQYF